VKKPACDPESDIPASRKKTESADRKGLKKSEVGPSLDKSESAGVPVSPEKKKIFFPLKLQQKLAHIRPPNQKILATSLHYCI